MGVAWKESTPEGLRPPQYSEGGGAPGFMIFFYFEVGAIDLWIPVFSVFRGLWPRLDGSTYPRRYSEVYGGAFGDEGVHL